MKNFKTKDIVTIALMAALLCVVAPLAIPLSGGVPISLATLMVMLIGVVLKKKAVYSVLIYLILGAVGLPVFSSYQSGFSVLFGPTGGYLIGYLPLAYIVGMVQERGLKRIGSMILGNLCLYVIGTIWFMVVMDTGLLASLTMCVIPFLPGDIIKMIAVYLLEPAIKKITE